MAESVRLRPIVLPPEHGSWAFLLEPLVLALGVAPSGTGALLALAAVAVFLLRNPVRVMLRMRARRGAGRRRAVAARAAAVLALIAAAALGAAWPRVGAEEAVVLALASVLGTVFVALDVRGEARSAVAEAAVPLALAAFAGAIVLAGADDGPSARALAVTVGAVSLAKAWLTIVHVRTRIAITRARGGPIALRWGRAVSVLAHALALAAAAAARRAGLVGTPVVLGALVLLVRTEIGLSPRALAWSIRRVGVVEACVSATFVALAIAGIR